MEKRPIPTSEAPAAVSELQVVPAPLAEHLPTLLWDVDPETIDPQAMARTIVQRVIQRGSKEDWAAMLAYYGRPRVQEIVETVPYMSDAAITAVCQFFHIEKETLRCYQRKQSIPQTFTS